MTQQFEALHQVPNSTLEKAGSLIIKTAYLSGLIAPETAACLSELLKGVDSAYSSMIDGHTGERDVDEHALLLTTQQEIFGEVTELRRRVIAVLSHQHHLLQTTPSHEGGGARARMLTYHHFAELGLLPHLWSLSRGLSRRRVEYQSLICKNDPTQGTVLEGGRQLKGDDALVFIEFMLGVCHEEVDYMTTAFSRRRLHEQVLQSFKTSQRIARSGISPKVAPAVLALLIQGALPETEFKIFSGVRLDEVSDETSNLRSLGLMDFSSHDTGWIETRLPAWFANEILPGLLDQ